MAPFILQKPDPAREVYNHEEECYAQQSNRHREPGLEPKVHQAYVHGEEGCSQGKWCKQEGQKGEFADPLGLLRCILDLLQVDVVHKIRDGILILRLQLLYTCLQIFISPKERLRRLRCFGVFRAGSPPANSTKKLMKLQPGTDLFKLPLLSIQYIFAVS